jgi:ATP/ADP translocase
MANKSSTLKDTISSDIVYQELYNEMRRFRDYELSISGWYTTIILGITGVIITIKAALYSSGKSETIFDYPLLKISLVAVIIFLVAASVLSVLYVWYLNKQLRAFTRAALEPDWNREPRKLFFKPSWLMVATQITLGTMAIIVLCYI